MTVETAEKIKEWLSKNWLVLASIGLIVFLFFFFFTGLIWPLILSSFGLAPAVYEASRRADNKIKTIEYFADKHTKQLEEEHKNEVQDIERTADKEKKDLETKTSEELKKSLMDEIK